MGCNAYPKKGKWICLDKTKKFSKKAVATVVKAIS
jgi:hypothetical protein